MTLIQAQERYIERVTTCHAGHQRRVERSARRQLVQWAAKRGFDGRVVWKDADDMARLERSCND
jgi:hypothetical protein